MFYIDFYHNYLLASLIGVGDTRMDRFVHDGNLEKLGP